MTWKPPKHRKLVARWIPKSEYPKIVESMKDDGLSCFITPKGLRWYAGRYVVAAKEVYVIWGLTRAQYKRFRDYILVNNPWGDAGGGES